MDRRLTSTQDSSIFFHELREYAAQQLSPSEEQALFAFAEQFFDRYPLEELAGRHLSDIFGAVFQYWRFLQQYDRKAPNIRAFNPNLEEDGWVCPYTVLVVLQRDMPFLVDSIRIELNRRNIAIHAIKSTVVAVARDAHHQLQTLAHRSRAEEEGELDKEALIMLEISLRTEEHTLHDLVTGIDSVLAEVDVVVADYQPLVERALDAEENLNLAHHAVVAAQVEESQAFLRWIVDNHFTFLGYAEYEFGEEDGVKLLRERVDKRLGIFALKGGGPNVSDVDHFNNGMARFHLAPQVLTFSKSSVRSRVHRQAYSDYIVVKRFNAAGEICGEARFLGLYTSAVYTMSPRQIPLIGAKVAKVFERSELDPDSHDGKALQQILDTFPRDELFLSTSAELYELVTGVAQMNERYMVRLFMRKDLFGKFVTCLVYVPRDVFTTRLRLKIQALIGEALGTQECEFTTWFSESILARVHLVFKVDPNRALYYDQQELQARIVAITRSWDDDLQDALLDAHGEEKTMEVLQQYREAFPSAYQETYDSRTAVHDIDSIAELRDARDIAMSFYQPAGAEDHVLRFKIFHLDTTLELSDVIPILEHMGLRVITENPYEIRRRDGSCVWLHDFTLSHNLSEAVDVHAVRKSFQEAFEAIWHKRTDNDVFNRLILSGRLNWREVMLFRAYASYMRQTLFNFTESYIANTLVNQVAITRNLIALFKAKFDPRLNESRDSSERIERLRNKILEELDSVANLNEDRILRRYLLMLDATLRTNYFQRDAQGAEKEYLSLKFSPRQVPDIPAPRPLYEIYVFSLRMEGVHLRGGKVARGGLRWSDRLPDYRTEVLGLVKAQQVKNAVIVPNGAKGGFVCKQMPVGASRDDIQQEGIACYKMFIRGLLDITDNLRDGEIVKPVNVLCFDQDDPYLVVAADKGTATFSDIANGISAEYNFWLGDAFASGGSQGYDHKAMGITARGAWISVQRHFKEKDINIQEQDFTVIGIGDMGGDVFGNGMLLSPHIRLIAAFNHQHIFIDPQPDAKRSFRERERLFKLPRSSWMDYDKSLISEGGGVFPRDLKSIAITPEMKAALAIDQEKLTPGELVHALLKAPVDLLWNGGIGTYVKSSEESHADVGDKANDNVRVNGNELRCKVFGEGGNLGMTQLGRVEYCLNGGACNTDFIDNAGGVDCSDHEVNVKILLDDVVAKGDLTQKQRNQLLMEMTENVAQLVLHNNYRQTQAISIAQADALKRGAEYRRFMSRLQVAGRLDRALEFLPNDDSLIERQSHGKGLTRPELAILISYAKATLKEDLAETDIASDPYIAGFIEGAFPLKIAQDFKEPLYRHRLRREIIATQIANDIVNNMGISFAQRLMESTGADVGELAAAYITARNIFQLDSYWRELEQLDYHIPAALQIELMIKMMRRVRRATRWFLRNRRGHLDPGKEVEIFTRGMQDIASHLSQLLRGQPLEDWQARCAYLQEQGLPEAFVKRAAMPGYLFSGLSVVDAAQANGTDLLAVADLYATLGEYLELPWFAEQISDVKVENYWQAMARESFMDDLETQLRTLATQLIPEITGGDSIDAVVSTWGEQNDAQVKRWTAMINELQASSHTDFAVFSVALRELRDLIKQ
ncbi:MAG TPA: NAD-glutamate dehydrogenase [Cellvibrio sp.]|nr:NAD-glutamate dehydrogenase [Cellvibrio sp.]